jgi:CBS domain containing-hemolysin-like protein
MTVAAALAVFALGLWLSAFFSGAETGFYRISFVRLSIDAHAGDRSAQRVLWFARHPAAFVATTLVGNNVANFLAAQGVAMAVVAIVTAPGVLWEIGGTLAIAPVVFIFGELMPKNLYFRSPQKRLLRNAPLFGAFFCLFAPLSAPLILLTSWLGRFGTTDQHATPLVLGRKRLEQVLEEGHEQGLLADIQNRLVGGLLNSGRAPVESSFVPRHRIPGLPQSASREQLLDHARHYGLTEVAVHPDGEPGAWFACVRVLDLAVGDQDMQELLIPLPRIEPGTSRLDALMTLNELAAPLGAVVQDDLTLGLVSRRRLAEQLFRRQAPA